MDSIYAKINASGKTPDATPFTSLRRDHPYPLKRVTKVLDPYVSIRVLLGASEQGGEDILTHLPSRAAAILSDDEINLLNEDIAAHPANPPHILLLQKVGRSADFKIISPKA